MEIVFMLFFVRIRNQYYVFCQCEMHRISRPMMMMIHSLFSMGVGGIRDVCVACALFGSFLVRIGGVGGIRDVVGEQRMSHRTAPNRAEPRRTAPIRADPRRSYSVYRRNHAKPRQTAPNHAEPRRTTPKARHCDTKRDSPKFLTVRRVCDTSESVAALTISPNSQENKTDMLMFSLMLVCFCKQKMAATLF
jgi:hypothetical protein